MGLETGFQKGEPALGTSYLVLVERWSEGDPSTPVPSLTLLIPEATSTGAHGNSSPPDGASAFCFSDARR